MIPRYLNPTTRRWARTLMASRQMFCENRSSRVRLYVTSSICSESSAISHEGSDRNLEAVAVAAVKGVAHDTIIGNPPQPLPPPPPTPKPIYLNFTPIAKPSSRTGIRLGYTARQNEAWLRQHVLSGSTTTTDANVTLHEAYHVVIECWRRKESRNALVRAEMWLEEMEKEVVLPTLDAVAQKRNNPFQLLHHDNDISKKSPRLKKLQIQDELKMQSKPTFLDTYKLVLSGWVESKVKDSTIRAEYWLRHLLELHAAIQLLHGNLLPMYYDLAPDAACFSHVVRAWANSNHRDAPEQCQAWFRSWIEFEQKKHGQNAKPGSAACSNSSGSRMVSEEVLRCWANSNRVDAGEQAERWLRQMCIPLQGHRTRPLPPLSFEYGNDSAEYFGYDKAGSTRPTIREYSLVIEAYTNSQKRYKFNVISPVAVSQVDLALSAERLLMEMMRMHWDARNKVPESTVEKISSIFLSVILALSRVDLLHRAEALLLRLEQLLAAKQIGVGFNDGARSTLVMAHNTILQSFARTLFSCSRGRGDIRDRNFCIQRLNRAFDRMVESDLPTQETCRIMMSAFGEANRGSGTAPSRVIEIFNSLQQKPNVADYNALLNAWRLSGCPGAVSEMEKLIKIMKESQDAAVRPNGQTCIAIILALANSNISDAYVRSEHWFIELLSLTKEALDTAEASLLLAFIVRCCLHFAATFRGSEQLDPPDTVALRVYEKIKGYGVTPDHDTYVNLIICVGRCQTRRGEKDDLIRGVFADCIEEGKLHPILIDELQRIMLPQNFQEIFDPANVPDSWTRNVYRRRYNNQDLLDREH